MRIHISIGLLMFFCLTVDDAQAQQRQFETFEYSEGDTTYMMKKYYLCIYTKGENRTQGKEVLDQLMDGHLAHIQHMADAGVVQVAGPIDNGEDSHYRGLLIFSVYDPSEAEEWIKKDPMVRERRLSYEIYPFWAAKGSRLD